MDEDVKNENLINDGEKKPTTPIIPKKMPSLVDASVFITHIRTRDFSKMPTTISEKIRDILQAWHGTSLERTDLGEAVRATSKLISDEEFRDLRGEPGRLLLKIIATPPPQLPLEEVYHLSELSEKFPQALELNQYLTGENHYKLHLHTTGQFYIIERPGGGKTNHSFSKNRQAC